MNAMIVEKPCLDRTALQREEERALQQRRRFEELEALLAPDEALGTPVRTGDRIVLSVRRAEAAGAVV